MSIEPGAPFGRLTVVADQGHNDVRCSCSCGTLVVVSRHRLRSGDTKSCGCLRSELLRQRWEKYDSTVPIDDGAVYGRLTVTSVRRQTVTCTCSCGESVQTRRFELANGKVRSCGCLMRELNAQALRERATRHGGYGTREWNIWSKMLHRCRNPDAMGYENYGGRGIQVCNDWQGPTGFQKFFEYLGPAPSAVHSVDRISNSGDYTPGNVRWATPKEQARNRRNNHLVKAFDSVQCLAAWSEETGLSSTTIRLRLLKGWPAEAAVSRR